MAQGIEEIIRRIRTDREEAAERTAATARAEAKAAPKSDADLTVHSVSYSADRQGAQVVLHGKDGDRKVSLTRRYRREGSVWTWGVRHNKGQKTEKFVVLDTRDSL